MGNPEAGREAEIASIRKELEQANRDIADYYMGEGAGAHMMKQDVEQVEEHKRALEERLKQLGIDVAK